MFRKAGEITMQPDLARAVRKGELRDIDLHTALFLDKLAEKSSPELLIAAALVSRAVGEGHICLPLANVSGKEVFSPDIPCQAPETDVWRQKLLASGVVGTGEGDTPLILDHADRLYLARHFMCEQRIATDLINRSKEKLPVVEKEAISLITKLFSTGNGDDGQKIAAAVAVLKRFVVISGGPGTGKTYTVARILALLQKLAGGELRIGLVAPTGKAAVRLQESIESAKQSMPGDLAELVPAETKTLHRLLGFHPVTGQFRHNRQNRLHLDLLIIDEASMIDVELMAALVEALPEKTRVVMLGDKDQLTSVEAGSLFGDICSTREPEWSKEFCEQVQLLTGCDTMQGDSKKSFGESVVLLQKSYRFKESEGIARLASLVNSGKANKHSTLLEDSYEDLQFLPPEEKSGGRKLENILLSGFRQCFASRSPEEALKALARFRILCAVREGAYGVEGMNLYAEKIFRRHGYIRNTDQRYQGRPLIIRNNHYGLQLFNGDTGIIWPDSQGKLWAWFISAEGNLHQVPLSRLPKHDTAYAITVHQSQGSEFAEVLFLLPAVESRVLSRELIYTGITRARKKLWLSAEPHIMARGIENRAVRYSGLGEKLWGIDT